MVPALAGPQQSKWFAALDRARLAAVKPTYVCGEDYYKIVSPHAGDTYIIRRVETDNTITYSCTCKAGERGLICWHAAQIAALPYESNRRRALKATPKPEPKPADKCPCGCGMATNEPLYEAYH